MKQLFSLFIRPAAALMFALIVSPAAFAQTHVQLHAALYAVKESASVPPVLDQMKLRKCSIDKTASINSYQATQSKPSFHEKYKVPIATTTDETAVTSFKQLDHTASRYKATESHPFSNTVISRSTTQTNSGYVRPSAGKRFKKYISGVVGPFALVGYAVTAGIAQATDNPEEWEDDSKGFGRRLASNFGQSAINDTTRYVLDESFRVDSNFYKSTKKGFKARLGDALLSNVTARKPDGKRIFGFPRIIGVYTGAIVAREAWFPNRFDYKDGLLSGSASLAAGFGFNILREFLFPGD